MVSGAKGAKRLLARIVQLEGDGGWTGRRGIQRGGGAAHAIDFGAVPPTSHRVPLCAAGTGRGRPAAAAAPASKPTTTAARKAEAAAKAAARAARVAAAETFGQQLRELSEPVFERPLFDAGALAGDPKTLRATGGDMSFHAHGARVGSAAVTAGHPLPSVVVAVAGDSMRLILTPDSVPVVKPDHGDGVIVIDPAPLAPPTAAAEKKAAAAVTAPSQPAEAPVAGAAVESTPAVPAGATQVAGEAAAAATDAPMSSPAEPIRKPMPHNVAPLTSALLTSLAPELATASASAVAGSPALVRQASHKSGVAAGGRGGSSSGGGGGSGGASLPAIALPRAVVQTPVDVPSPGDGAGAGGGVAGHESTTATGDVQVEVEVDEIDLPPADTRSVRYMLLQGEGWRGAEAH